MCVWVLNPKTSLKKIVCGIVVIDIITGKSIIFETETEIIYDELERYVSTYQPNEVLFIEQGESRVDSLEKIFNAQISFHKIDVSSPKIKNVQKQTYVEEILNKQFGRDTYHNCFEFNTYPLATMAFCYLLDFIYEHNPNLMKNIEIPFFNNSSDYVILANHTLRQLNILDDGQSSGHLSCVLSFLNKCSCPMGRRRFREQLLHPVYNKKWLQTEYDMIHEVLKPENKALIAPFRKWLGTLCDIEKIARQITIKKIFPQSIHQLYTSLDTIEQINVCLMETQKIQKYLYGGADDLSAGLKNMMQFIKDRINMEVSQNQTDESGEDILEDEKNIICSGVSVELDTLMQEEQTQQKMLEQWRETLNQMVRNVDNRGKRKEGETQYIKIYKTEKSGVSLQITKTRTGLLKEALKTCKTITIMGQTFDPKELSFSTASSNANEIECGSLTQISKRLLSLKDSIQKVVEREYKVFLEKLEATWCPLLTVLVQYIGKLDVLICRAHNAIQYNYCCPVLEEKDDERSYVEIQDLRHVLIEHLITNETYTANDVELTRDPQGILLFGVNSSGKTSLLRSLGISLILAQSGHFVPATRFKYNPYRSIYSRIIGNDNLFKGQSSFTVEMEELNVILKYANRFSLVLADEISKGSEMLSAICITSSAILHFIQQECSFMITSHLHQVIDIEDIKGLSNCVHLKHLAVSCVNDKLVYDRRLREGSGDSFYGLLVCKSLHLPSDFIETAFKIRNKLVKIPGILSQKTSAYNSKKIRGVCEMCEEEMSQEIHHILPQKDAQPNGFLEKGVYIHHVGNLKALCSKCHDRVHKKN
jgi:DNA mismatch repair protein MutS